MCDRSGAQCSASTGTGEDGEQEVDLGGALQRATSWAGVRLPRQPSRRGPHRAASVERSTLAARARPACFPPLRRRRAPSVRRRNRRRSPTPPHALWRPRTNGCGVSVQSFRPQIARRRRHRRHRRGGPVRRRRRRRLCVRRADRRSRRRHRASLTHLSYTSTHHHHRDSCVLSDDLSLDARARTMHRRVDSATRDCTRSGADPPTARPLASIRASRSSDAHRSRRGQARARRR